MGEIAINPIHNVHKKYRQMNLVNPYIFAPKVLPFISTWKTNNSGVSTATQIKLPLVNSGTYNFTVNWGDGNSNIITTYNQSEIIHTYSLAGTYTVTITGVCKGWSFANTGDKLKILSIQQWGCISLGTNQGDYFNGCSNLTLLGVSDVLNTKNTVSFLRAFQGCSTLTTLNLMNEWNMSEVTNIEAMFALATNFNQDISSWNTSNIINMQAVFFSAQKFNQNIGSWNVSKVTSFQNMFVDAQRFNQNIGSWNTVSAVNIGGMFSNAIDFNQNIGSWNVSNVTSITNFMSGKTPLTFSSTNLDAIYNGWSTRSVKSNLVTTFGSAKYTIASSAGRANLTGVPNNWTITDGGI